MIVGNRPGEAVGIRLMDVPDGTLDAGARALVPVLHMKPGELRRRIKDYLYPSTLEQNADGSLVQLPHLAEGGGEGDHRPRPDRAQARREPQGGDLPQGAHAAVPRGRDPGRVAAVLPAGRHGGAACSATSARSRPSSSSCSTSRATSRATSSATTAWSSPTTSGCAGATAWPASRSTPSGGPSRRDPVGGRMPDAGDTLVTTIDSKVQAAAEQALRTGISLAHSDGQYAANGGAAVVHGRQERRRPRHGELPDLRPQRLGRRHRRRRRTRISTRKSANYPLLNRATRRPRRWARRSRRSRRWRRSRRASSRRGPPSGAPATTSRRTTTPIAQKFKCWALDGHGNLALIGAITQSCDVYFYNVGNMF